MSKEQVPLLQTTSPPKYASTEFKDKWGNSNGIQTSSSFEIDPEDEDRVDYKDYNGSTYGLFTALAVMLNYLIGSGAFGLPYAFYLSGLPLAVSCIVFFSVLSTLCAMWIPEVMARANGELAIRQRSQKFREMNMDVPTSLPGRPEQINVVGYKPTDLTIIARLFGGCLMETFSHLAMLSYVYTVLWSYSAAWASSVDTLFFEYVMGEKCNVLQDAAPSAGCLLGYYGSLAVFAAFAVVMSLMDVSEQAGIQRIMTGYRFVAFFLMGLSVFIALWFPNPFDPAASQGLLHTSNINDIKWAGFGTMFSFTAVSFNVQYNLPNVFQPVHKSSKPHLLRVAVGGIMVSAAFYLFIGWICAIFFGPQTLALVTLNWQNYTGTEGGWGSFPSGSHIVQLLAVIVKLTIILFPVVNVMSAYPLVAVTLGDNLLHLIPGSIVNRFPAPKEAEFSPTLQKLSRLLASVPPIIAAALVWNLGKILTLTGLFGFFLELTIPALLELLSSNYMVRNYGQGWDKTPYTTFFSGRLTIWIVLILSTIAFFFGARNAIEFLLS